MKLPISFDDVAYFNGEYRGDLIVTTGVLYYFPHTRVTAARYKDEMPRAQNAAQAISAASLFVDLAGAAPWILEIANTGIKTGRLIKRSFLPSTNRPRIREYNLWSENLSCKQLQAKLDSFIEVRKAEALEFQDDAVPKPMRFCRDEMENARLGIKFRFDAKYDNHDFRVSPLIRTKLKNALTMGGFLN